MPHTSVALSYTYFIELPPHILGRITLQERQYKRHLEAEGRTAKNRDKRQRKKASRVLLSTWQFFVFYPEVNGAK